ncbi:hypothetical protein SDC9_176709 [bioreactor metagenome]|uniref:Uncharacterized protein n=1 Tax=bioreactor metagenome TaxID=1076179 RepID=A0A645GQU0_9ZZZZ
MGAYLAHQALGDDALQRAGNEVGLHPQVHQPVDGGKGVVCVNGGEHQVARHGGAQGDLGGFAVADFADGHNVRVLPQHGPQAGGEGKAGFFVDLHLVDPVDVVFHRVLQGDKVHRFGVQLPDHGVHGGGFA